MKRLFFFLLLFLSLVEASQEPTKHDNRESTKPTHILELLQPQADKPIPIGVTVYKVDKQNYISIPLPGDKPIKIELRTIENEVKFQMAAFRNNGLVAVQYIGKGHLDGVVKGTFAALVDGVFRKDMAGTFRLVCQ